MTKRTPLFEKHISLGAKMVPFSGWEMPVSYSGIVEEHLHCRESVGLFDICHMGEFFVQKAGAGDFLNCMLTSNPSGIPVGKCRYGLMLKEDGGVLDDCITYHLSEEEFMIVVNAGTREGDLAHLKKHLPKGVSLEDRSDAMGKIDLQGPKSFEVLEKVYSKNFNHLKYFSFERDGETIISRTGYTGELGVEIYAPVDEIIRLWDTFLEDSLVKPIGLGARDTIRLECGMSLYGHELDESTPAGSCGVDRFIRKENDFIGRAALEAIENSSEDQMKTSGFKADSRSAARSGEKILLDGEPVGEVTSGSFAPSLGYSIALARVSQKALETGGKWSVSKGRRELSVEPVPLPFYQGGTARKKLV